MSRISARYHQIISDTQFGFKKSSGTIDAIFCLRQIIHNSRNPVHCIFLDLRGAFDRLPRQLLIEIVRIMLGSDKIANLLAKLHSDTISIIKNGTEYIKINSGVRQGSDEGPILFNIFFQYVLSVIDKIICEDDPEFGVEFYYNIHAECDTNTRANRNTGAKSGKCFVDKLLYADDLVLLDTDAGRLERRLHVVNKVFARFGLIVAGDKTKSMSYKLSPGLVAPKFTIGDIVLECVDNFKYLGFMTSSNLSKKLIFLQRQKQCAWAAFNRNKLVLTNKKIPIKTRVKLLDSLVKSILLYAAQAWYMTAKEKLELDVTYRTFLRLMVRKGWKNKVSNDGDSSFNPIISNDKLYRITGACSLVNSIDKQFVKYQAHILRMPNKAIQKKLQFIRKPENSTVENVWTKLGLILGGIGPIQCKMMLFDKKKFRCIIDRVFGKREK